MKTAIATALLALAAGSACAGTAVVRFVDPGKYGDAGFGSYEIERTTKALAGHLDALASRLPDGQVLQVEILDVDLAGRVYPGPIRDLRIATGGADWPRIKLRYTLADGNRTLQAGEATLTDMNYLWPNASLPVRDEFGYEFRLLDRWFKTLTETR